jgi:hypothetical protein
VLGHAQRAAALAVVMELKQIRPLCLVVPVVSLDPREHVPLYMELLAALHGGPERRGGEYLGRVAYRDNVPAIRYTRRWEGFGPKLENEPRLRPFAIELEVILIAGEQIEAVLTGLHDELRPLGLGVLDVMERREPA